MKSGFAVPLLDYMSKLMGQDFPAAIIVWPIVSLPEKYVLPDSEGRRPQIVIQAIGNGAGMDFHAIEIGAESAFQFCPQGSGQGATAAPGVADGIFNSTFDYAASCGDGPLDYLPGPDVGSFGHLSRAGE